MKLHFLVQERRAASSRYRALQYCDGLRARGWEVVHDAVPSGAVARTALLIRASRADVAFVQRRRLPGWQWRLLASRGARIVWDVDDAVWLRSSRHAERRSNTRAQRFEASARAVDLIVAGNETVAAHARPYNERVVVQPLSFDVASHPVRSRPALRREGELCLGWIGGGKSLAFLEVLGPTLAALGTRHTGLGLAVVSDRSFEIAGLRCIQHPWSESDEKAQVAGFDIGLAPLPDDEWARAKCGTRLLQCMSAAVPCVASPVGVQADIVEHGVNGLLAETPDEWQRALESLIADAALRERLGRAARETVARDFSLERWTGELDRALRKLVEEPL